MPSTAAVAFIQQAQAAFLQRVGIAHQRAGQPATRVTSWVRDPSHNRSVGGAPDSQHLIGTALDLVEGSGALAAQLQGLGLVVERKSTHTHVQLWPRSVHAVERIAPDLIRR